MDIALRQIARDIAFTMPLSKIHSHNPLKINFRCPICGDSKTDKYKTRGWFYEYKNDLRFGCFNCSANHKFTYFLKEHHPEKYKEYLLDDVFKNKEQKEEDNLDKFTKVIPVVKQNVIDRFGTRIDLLPDGHPAKIYMTNRMIPEHQLSLFWFTMDWRELANNVRSETYKFVEKEPRIVIPIYNDELDITSVQGRALRSTEKNRYVTIKTHDDANKIFGTERVDDSRDVFFLEGPIDSVFIDNGLAIVGGNLSPREAPYAQKRVWVLDNEARSVDTCKRILKLIEANEKVVLWDKCRWSSKDVNDMVMKEGATVKEINDYLRNNIVQGLMAQMRFNEWVKCKL